MSRKIAIVGASIDAFIQLHYLISGKNSSSEYDEDQIVLIHDPDKVYPFLLSPVGTALFGGVESEYTSLNLNRSFAHKHFAATDCHGSKFIGWGNHSNFNVTVTPQVHTHLDIEKFREYFIKDGGKSFGDNISIIEEKIDSFNIDEYTINGVEYDYIIDCTEKEPLIAPDDYGTPVNSFTNTVMVLEKPFKGDWDFTIQYAAKYGHVIGIPLGDKQLWAYYYDNTKVAGHEIKDDFVTLFPDEHIPCCEPSEYTFTKVEHQQKVSNYIIDPTHNRYIRNGRSAFTFEPITCQLQLGVQTLSNIIKDHIYSGHQMTGTLQNFGEMASEYMLPLVSFMFQYGSIHDNEFWNNAKKVSCDHLELSVYTHPYDNSDWRDNILTDDWGDKEYKKVLTVIEHEETRPDGQTALPYRFMEIYSLFYELASGLGASYADKFDSFDIIYPPENFGEIGYTFI